MQKIVHSRRDPHVALQCYLDYLAGKTEVDIGREHDWALQSDAYEKVRWCKTAHRYIEEGEAIYIKKGMLREKAFGIKFVRSVRSNRRKMNKMVDCPAENQSQDNGKTG